MAISLQSGLSRGDLQPAAATELIQLAVTYNDALNQCALKGGANIDELMDPFAEDATWFPVGVRDVAGVSSTSLIGEDAIRASFLARTALHQQVVELKRIDVWGDLVVGQVERRDATLPQPGSSARCGSRGWKRSSWPRCLL